MWELLHAIPVKTLHQIGKRAAPTDYAVRFFNNKQHPMFYRNRETLEKAIRRAANGLIADKVYLGIVDWLCDSYRFDMDHVRMGYNEEKLEYCRSLHVVRNGKHHEILFEITVLPDGSHQRETFFSSGLTEAERALFTWYGDTFTDHLFFGNIKKRKAVKPLLDFLKTYWNMENRRYVYHLSEDTSSKNVEVLVSIDGLDDHPMRISLNVEERKINTIHLDSLDFRNLGGIFNEAEILAFIMEESPLRLPFLYQ